MIKKILGVFLGSGVVQLGLVVQFLLGVREVVVGFVVFVRLFVFVVQTEVGGLDSVVGCGFLIFGLGGLCFWVFVVFELIVFFRVVGGLEFCKQFWLQIRKWTIDVFFIGGRFCVYMGKLLGFFGNRLNVLLVFLLINGLN